MAEPVTTKTLERAIAANDLVAIRAFIVALTTELDELRDNFNLAMTKLDADTGVADTDYEATLAVGDALVTVE